MNFNFDDKINNFLKIILKNALKLDYRVFFVGGIVRDKILNVPTYDIDLLLMGNAIEFSQSLPSEINVKSVHSDFGTVKLEYCGVEIDIASSRAEIYPNSGCLPVVDKIGVEIQEDVLRRDFTVNSLYCKLKVVNDEVKYELIDLVDGVKDIKNKTLRVLHAKSYIDDPTRILRGVGFKYRFGFEFSECDNLLIKEYLSNIKYDNMSYDRNIKVLKYVLSSNFQDEVFTEIVEKKYYKIINHDDLEVNLEYVFDVCKKFNLDFEQKKQFYISILLNNAVEKKSFKTILDIYKYFIKFNFNELVYYFYKTKDKNVFEFIKIRDIKLNINGDDLIQLGFKQGRQIGEILDKILLRKLEKPSFFTNKQDEMTWIKNNFLN